MTLNDFFARYPRVAIAFSGGVDSAYLLYAATRYARAVQAYYVKSDFQPQFELEDALRLAEDMHAALKVLRVDVLSDANVTANPPNRCYFCKRRIFKTIRAQAAADGFSVLLDGTNASDDVNDRPGVRALEELSVLSPLRMCSLTQDELRRLSKEAGLFTWDKPAYACLATRIPSGDTITLEKLRATERAEGALFAMGFRDFRVRRMGDAAKLQLREDQLNMALANRERILAALRGDYSAVLLDLEVRK